MTLMKPNAVAPEVPTVKAGTSGSHQTKRKFRVTKKRLLVAVSAMLAVTSVAVGGSWAAWTATDTNANTLNTNTILLDDNQGGQGGSAVSTGVAMINTSAVEPGWTSGNVCMEVAFSGTAAISTLTLGGAMSGTDAAAIGPVLKMTTATLSTDGTGTPTAGSNTNSAACTNYGTGTTTVGTQGAALNSWCSTACTISSPVTNTWYKFKIDDNSIGTCANYCGKVSTFTLTWTLTTT